MFPCLMFVRPFALNNIFFLSAGALLAWNHRDGDGQRTGGAGGGAVGYLSRQIGTTETFPDRM